jgi:hypothetical protein
MKLVVYYKKFLLNKIIFNILYYTIHANIFFAIIQKIFFKYFRYKKLLFEIKNINIPLSHYSSFLFKTFEINDRIVLEKFLTKKNKCIIIGTGIGFTGALAYELSKNKILCIEVDHRLKKIIEKNFLLNKTKYTLIFKNLNFDKKKSKSYFVFKENFLLNQRNKDSNEKNLVDNIYYKNLPITKYNSLIIDAEGYEYELIKNIKKLKSIKNIFFELHPEILTKRQQQQIFNILSEYNFVKKFDFLNSYYFQKVG